MQKAGKIKIIVDKKKAADGREFFAAGIRGKFIPKDLAKALGAEEDSKGAILPPEAQGEGAMGDRGGHPSLPRRRKRGLSRSWSSSS